jgi:dCTP deaminase
MGLLSDAAIIDRISRPDDDPNRLRISDFQPGLIKEEKKPSWGTSCYGYDCRLAADFAYVDMVKLSQSESPYLEPGKEAPWIHVNAPSWILYPGDFVMARTMEYIRIPRDCGGVVFGKSTWARLAVCLNTTLLEPEWEGEVTLEISNIGNFPVILRAGSGICQVVLGTADSAFPLVTSYADRKNPTYQGQRGVTLSKV